MEDGRLSFWGSRKPVGRLSLKGVEVKKRLSLCAVLLAVLGLFFLYGVGAAREGLQPRAYLPVVEKFYDDVPLPAPVAWRVTQLSSPPGYVTSLAGTSNGNLLAISLTDAGIQAYRSPDEGGSWSMVDEPVLGREIRAYRLYPSPSRSLDQVVLASGFSGLARSGDGGVSWQRVDASLPIKQIVALAFSPDSGGHEALYALSAQAGGLGPYLYRSTDQGETWQTIAGITGIRQGGLVPNDLAAFGPGGLVIATSSGILWSDDSGATWQHEGEAFAEPGRVPAVRAVAGLASGQLLAVTSGRRISYKSSDGGRTWRWTGHGMDEGGQYQGGLALALAPGRVFLAAAGAQGVAPGLFYSPDGESWRDIPLGLEAGSGISALYALADDRLLVAAGERGLWKVEAIP